MNYDIAVFVGRFQPPHREHIQQILRGLELAKHVVIVFGSHLTAPSPKNPWTSEEREEMVTRCLPEDVLDRVHFGSVRDYMYNDLTWLTNLVEEVNWHVENLEPILKTRSPKICVIGSKKDESTWYLDILPESWKRELSILQNPMHATDARNYLLGGKHIETIEGAKEFRKIQKTYNDCVPQEVHDYIYKEWIHTRRAVFLKDEWKHYYDYKRMWAAAPYPVTFVTADAMVVKNGHVLLIKRGFNPGKGLLALPGGFINQNESIQESAIRELKEETRILMPKDQLRSHIVDQRVFDHPGRSLRGRTITHCFCIKLPDGGELPKVKGGDDADKARWYPIADALADSEKYFEDHYHMLTYFLNKL